MTIDVQPELDSRGLFSKLDYRDVGVPDLVRRGRRDAYRLKVDLVSPGELVDLEHGLSVVETFGRRRLLTLHEFLCLNRHDLAIRYRYPVFIEDYVLEFKIEDAVGVEGDDCRRDWAIRPSGYHRGQIIDKDSVFATTELTLVDLGELTEESLKGLPVPPEGGTAAPAKK